eukprot:CAMPEP_0206395290 /NCGR_PEP_ID=MMETSP0294-20121207/21976_1 /ASSEMBLY_ACC=CAM_ASM_000327 /TAXON_ID=39354 /ORGANISM="Heterosigma akashiwo, Strain CCMP2393" /LENGTH=65 /DNA_ID=CAMNT_0053849551 /DNA_START=742 /DNA_END=936 /DNA_ORIENTATION=+
MSQISLSSSSAMSISLLFGIQGVFDPGTPPSCAMFEQAKETKQQLVRQMTNKREGFNGQPYEACK